MRMPPRCRRLRRPPTVHPPATTRENLAVGQLGYHAVKREPVDLIWDPGVSSAHAAVSRRQPNPSDTIVPGTEGYTHGTLVWALSLVQGPFSVSPRTKP
jgi:hypothetical protein